MSTPDRRLAAQRQTRRRVWSLWIRRIRQRARGALPLLVRKKSWQKHAPELRSVRPSDILPGWVETREAEGNRSPVDFTTDLSFSPTFGSRRAERAQLILCARECGGGIWDTRMGASVCHYDCRRRIPQRHFGNNHFSFSVRSWQGKDHTGRGRKDEVGVDQST